MDTNQDPVRTVAKGTAVLTLFQFFSKILYLVFFIVLGNLPDEFYGRLEAVLALAGVLFILADLGIETWLTREASAGRMNNREDLSEVVALKTLLGTVAAGALVLWLIQSSGGEYGRDLETVLVIAGGVLYLFSLSAQSYIKSLARARHHMEVEGRMAVIEKILVLILGVGALATGQGLGLLVMAFGVAGTLACFSGLLRLKTLGVEIGGWKAPDWAILGRSYPFALSALCVLLFYYMDRIMIYELLEEGDVALANYSRGWRILVGLLMFPQMLSIAIYPMFSRLQADREERMRVARSGLYFLLFLAIPILFGGLATSGGLMDLLFPGDSKADPILWKWDSSLAGAVSSGNVTESAVFRILLLSFPFTCCNYLFGPALNALGKERQNLKASAITLGFNILLNLALIPVLGPVGAAIATSLSQAIYAIALYIPLYRNREEWFDWIKVAKTFCLGVAMGAVVHWLMGRLSTPASIGLGGAVYLAAALLLGLWPWRIVQVLARR